jgi:serine/threonine-protein kinase HipA
MMKHLTAFYESKKVGVLTKNDDDVYSFAYDKLWQADPNAFPISLSMPLAQEKFGNKVTLSFFENLLPEGNVRKELETSHKITGVFDFLAEFGKDCAGAIILTHDDDYRPPAHSGTLVPVDLNKVYEAIHENLSVAEVISDLNPGYLSLAGAQDKFPAVFKNGNFFLPENGYPTTHIVKVPIWRQGIKESVYNEYYCMELARAIGLDVPPCLVVDGDQPLFVIERYDRVIETNLVRRVHQQDLCQAQGFSSEYKYESAGGPSIKQNYDFILTHTSPAHRLPGLERFLDWIAFNLIIGNNDSHSKNISLLLHENKKYKIAQFYDLMSTAIYPRLERRFAFHIGGRNDFSKMGKKQFNELEKNLGLKQNVFCTRLQEISDKVTNQHAKVATTIETLIPRAKIANRISELIDDRIKGLKNQNAIL